jgi:16S rRNA (cytidine1402-2'-O)-methyltransferase
LDTFRRPALYVVSTPIGNLADITLRALEALKQADLIAAEDTRHSRILLDHYDIKTQLTSYHDHNKEEKAPVLVERLRQGAVICLISDAGTPAISDPGYYLINRCIQFEVPVIPIPGPSAVLAALAASGLPTDAFVFDGFLPRKRQARQRRLEQLRDEPRTLVFFESPHRVHETLAAIAAALGDRRVVLARELTKKFEEITRGRASELVTRLEHTPGRGEYTLVVEGAREITALW